MDGMEGIREAIDSVLNPEGHIARPLFDSEWEPIQAAIIAAQPPGENEICAALTELDKAVPTRAIHTITLAGCGAGGVHSGAGRECGFSHYHLAPTVIRDLITVPEPTPKEDWENVDAYIRYCSGVGIDPVDHPSRESVRESMDRLRKRVET